MAGQKIRITFRPEHTLTAAVGRRLAERYPARRQAVPQPPAKPRLDFAPAA